MTSPIRAMKNSNYNYQSSTSQNYEEEFWKLKAQKAQNTIQDLKKQNHTLNKRLIEMSRIEQQLRQKIIGYEDDWKIRSRKLATQRNTQRFSRAENEEKQAQTAEIQKLYKQIRIIKNVHEVQMIKLQEENKKLKKQIAEGARLQTNEKQNTQHLKTVSKFQQEISQLKRKLNNSEQNLARTKQEKLKLLNDNEDLKKEIQDIKMKQKIAQKEQEEKFLDYKKYFQQLNDIRISNRTQQPNDGNQVQEFRYQSPFMYKIQQQQPRSATLKEQSKQLLAEVQKLKKELGIKEIQEKQIQQKIRFEKSNNQNQRLSATIRLKKVEGDLFEAKSQLENVLRKLAPLLQSNKQLQLTKENTQTRVGLSILEVFLKKYRIQAF